MAQGSRQIQGIEVDEVFGPTSVLEHEGCYWLKLLRRTWKVHMVDNKTAFLNDDLEEEVFVTQPPGFEIGRPQVCRLKEGIVWTKTSPNSMVSYTRSCDREAWV